MPVVLGGDVGHRVLLYGSDGSVLRVIHTDASGDLQIDVLSSALPSGAATQATLASILAQLDVALSTRALEAGGNLDLIQINTSSFVDMRGPLGSVATDVYRIAEPRERNPVWITRFYGVAGVAPHLAVNRWTYTVPAGKKARLQTIFASMIQDAVAAVAGLVTASINYTPSGGSITRIAEATKINLAVGSEGHVGSGVDVLMGAGDLLQGVTSDANTGGTNRLLVSATIVEFAA